jgi:hypothetical protein
MEGHSISYGFGTSMRCSCGERFPDQMAALEHALPLNTKLLADQVEADPASSQNQKDRANLLAWESAQIARMRT